MSATTESQDLKWGNSVYFMIIMHIVIPVGIAYLTRRLYNLVSLTWGSRIASIVAPILSVLSFETFASNNLPAAPDLEAGLGQLRQEHAPREYELHMGTPQPSTTANAVQEQDIGVRQGSTHIEEDIRLDVELGG